MAWAPIAAAAVSAGTGLIGASKAADAAQEAQRIKDQAAEQIYGLDVPDLQDLQYVADKTEYTGDVDPTLISNLGDIQSSYNDITTDPRFATAQYQSLGALDDVINGGGMTAMDRLTAQNAMNDATMQSSRDQGAITRDLAERGLGGSGQELAMRMQAQQGAANTQANAAQTQAATAQQRALDAIMQRGTMASGMQDQSFSQQAKAASAKDLISQFNKNNAYDVNKTNAATQNIAATRNLDARQGVVNNNTAIGNTNKAANAGAVQQTYGNQMDKAVAAGNAATGQANSRIAAGEATKNMYGGIANAVTTGAGAYADYAKSQQPATKAPNVYAGQNLDDKTYG